MTANALIESIFSRAQANVPANVRFITTDQLQYLLSLIAQDPEAAALHSGFGGKMVWSPETRSHRYELEGDMHTPRRTITRLVNLRRSSGLLF